MFIIPNYLFSSGKGGFRKEFKDIFRNMLTLPRTIRKIVRLPPLPSIPPTNAPPPNPVYNPILVSHSHSPHSSIPLTRTSAWIAWFPILFYTTVYVGDLHKRASPTPQSDQEADALDAEATRLGSRALLFSSILSLVANVLLPFVVSEARQNKSPSAQTTTGSISRGRSWMEYCQVHLASLWAASHALFALCMLGTL
jgi:hypothetical protein